MKLFFLFLTLFLSKILLCQNNRTKPELVLTAGYNYGFNSDFVNTSKIKLGLRPSSQFQIGFRKPLFKNTLSIECGVGISSINPYFYIDKSKFTNPAAENVYVFLPSYFEIPNAYISFLKGFSVYKSNNLNFKFLTGISLKYIPKFEFQTWNTTNNNGTEAASFNLFFDENYNQNTALPYEVSRKIIVGSYFALEILPVKNNKRFINAEVYFNPSFNTGINTIYSLGLPGSQYLGNFNFKFSTFGIKIKSQIVKDKNQ